MAIGDDATAAGMDTLNGSEARRDGYLEINKTRDYIAQLIQADSLTVTIPAANTPVDTDIIFDRPFKSVPHVVATPSSPVATVGRSMITTTGFRLTVQRSSTTNTSVSWIAVGEL